MADLEPVCISKRCVKCGVQPSPSDMSRLWGWQWEKETMCKNCRDGAKKVLVIMVPKIKGMDVLKVEEWYIPIDLRRYAQKVYIEEPYSTKVYLSDGDRFWCWSDFPHRWTYYMDFERFIKNCPDWKMISPYGEKTYPEIKDYICC